MSIPYDHQPVLLQETLKAFKSLTLLKKLNFVDGTLGLAGHSLAIAKQLLNSQGPRSGKDSSDIRMIGIDKDQEALLIAKSRVEKEGLQSVFEFVHNDFHNIEEIMNDLGLESIDGMLLDLGVSSMQLDDKSRGFSFLNTDMPLDMRMDRNQSLSAECILNRYPEDELAEVLKKGEEHYFKKVAAVIVKSRKIKPFLTVGDLLEAIAPVLKRGYSKTHFATDTFRALRLEVNGEIDRLETTIKKITEFLRPEGILAIITFHSLEDRIVKNTFRQLANPCTCPPRLPNCVCGLEPQIKLMTKKPIIASEEELNSNPRARSAKLRIVQKI